MSKLTVWTARLLGVLVVSLSCAKVQAGGLYLFDRGARPTSRGGAWVAGADDPGALWYNPAGLAESRNQIMGDAVLSIGFIDYPRTREDGVTPIGPKVDAKPTPLPIPTLAFSNDFGLKNWVIGGGLFFPNALLINWPRSIDGANGRPAPAPQRYSLIGLQGTIFGAIAGGFAYKGIKHLNLGAAVHLSLGRFKAETALSACDGFACVNAEDPDYDAYATVALPVYGATGVLGATYELFGLVRWGVSVVLPYTLRGAGGNMDVRLPRAGIFQDASVDGEKANLEIKFPTILRVGSEIRPLPYLRMEGAFVWEQWSRQKSIDITPKDVAIENVTGIGRYELGTVKLDRRMNDMWSVRGGFELFVPARWMIRKWKDLNLALRGGLAFEKSAFKKETLTAVTVDADKVVLTGGLSFDLIPKWCRFDTTIGWIHMLDVDVNNSTIRQPTAIRPRPSETAVIGNGQYSMEAFFLGGALALLMK